MKFEDVNKKYSIEFEEIHNRHNGIVQASFMLRTTKPFQVETRFTDGDIKTLRGVDGINFYKSSKIAKAVGAKEDVLFSLTDEALNFIKSESEQGMVATRNQAADKIVKNWVWALGGDTHNLYISTDDLDCLEMQFRDDLNNIRTFIKKNDRRAMEFIRAHSQKTDRDTALYMVDGWNKISNEDLMKIYNQLKAEDAEQQKAKHDTKQAIFDKAAKTGDRQILRQWSDECCDPNEDCDFDNIIEYVMPDGSTKTKRFHTW